jgi:hypothetical protein
MPKLFYAMCPHCKGNVIVPSYQVGNANGAVLVDDQGRYQGMDEQASCSEITPDAFECGACGREVAFDIMCKGEVYCPPVDEAAEARRRLAALRLSVARLAIAMNIECMLPGDPNGRQIQEASTYELNAAARSDCTGWNGVVIHILDQVEQLRSLAADVTYRVGGNRHQR